MSASEFIFSQEEDIDGTGLDPLCSKGTSSLVDAPCTCCASTSDEIETDAMSNASATITNVCREERWTPTIAAATAVHIVQFSSPLLLPPRDFLKKFLSLFVALGFNQKCCFLLPSPSFLPHSRALPIQTGLRTRTASTARRCARSLFPYTRCVYLSHILLIPVPLESLGKNSLTHGRK